MRKIAGNELQEITTRIFDAIGSPHEESELVSEILVRSNLMGHDSHGVIRIAQYVEDIRNESLIPGSSFEVVQETACTGVVDGNGGWGHVVAHKAMQLAIEKARKNVVGVVIILNSHHVGRLGEYPSMAASQQMIGSAFANSFGGPDMVAPWGGIDSRLAPNPMAWAAPSGWEWPVLVDVTTSALPEGKVRVARYSGQQLPEGCLIDSEGNPTQNPIDLYEGGSLLTLGGAFGHKGYGLNLMVELMGGALSGMGCRGQKLTGRTNQFMHGGNGVLLQAIDIRKFVSIKEFVKSVQEVAAHVKSSRKSHGVDEILFPGEPEYRVQKQRLKEGVPVSDGVWNQICAIAEELKVEV